MTSKSARRPVRSVAPGSATRGSRRGRPRKFDQPSQVVALTLPVGVLDALRAIHVDPAWAIVQLVEQAIGRKSAAAGPTAPPPVAELARLPGGRALIVVRSSALGALPGVSSIPLADGRSFLAFDGIEGIAGLELAIADRLEELPADAAAATELAELRVLVRSWRRDRQLQFRTQQIIVVIGGAVPGRRPLTPLRAVGTRRSKPPNV